MKRSAAVFVVLALGLALVSGVEATARTGPRVVPGQGTNAPRFVGAINSPARSGAPVDVARAHLAANVSRYHIAEPASQLRQLQVVRTDGRTTVRFQQVHRGIPVFGAQYLVHMRKAPSGYSTTSVNGHYFTKLSTPAVPRLSADQARLMALARLRPAEVDAVQGHGLTILPTARGVLTHHFTVIGSRFERPFRQEVFVNAITGALALSYDNLQHAVPASGTGETAHGDTVPLEIFLRGTIYELRDQSRVMFVPGTSRGQITTHNAHASDDSRPSRTNIVRSSDDTVTGYQSRIGAVDAHWGAGEVYEYYLNLGRNSIDDNGMNIVSTVNVTEGGAPMYNASWTGTHMVYGYPNDGEVYPLSADLDVVGHELTHGVTQFSANLVYMNQSGAMNEAYSDYFGNAIDVESSGTGMGSAEAGHIGEDLCIVPNPQQWVCPLRDMNDGRTTQDFTFYLVDADSGGVHLNSTIYAGALWDIRERLAPARADEIIYESLNSHLTPLDNFHDGRLATLAASAATGGSQAEQNQIADAFADHGIVGGWALSGGNDSRIVRRNIAPLGLGFSAPQLSGKRYILGDYRNKEGICCVPEQIFVGKLAGGPARRIVNNPASTTFNDELPDLSGKRAVWSHLTLGLDFNVQWRKLGPKLGKRKIVAHKNVWEWYPSIDGKLVAWEAFDIFGSGRTAIRAKRLGSGKSFKVSGPRGDALLPQVAGDWVAFWKFTGARLAVVAKNLRTNRTVTVKGGKDAFVGPPSVRGRYMYFYRDANFLGAHPDFRGAIMRIQLPGGKPRVVVKGTSQAAPYWEGIGPPPAPMANRRYVTFHDEFGFSDASGTSPNEAGRDVWVVPASGGRPRRITSNRGDQAYAMMGNRRRVVWLDSSQGRTDIMTRRAP